MPRRFYSSAFGLYSPAAGLYGSHMWTIQSSTWTVEFIPSYRKTLHRQTRILAGTLHMRFQTKIRNYSAFFMQKRRNMFLNIVFLYQVET